jgi:hypothetical protein
MEIINRGSRGKVQGASDMNIFKYWIIEGIDPC